MLSLLHTSLRVHKTPGLPCALCLPRARLLQSSDAKRAARMRTRVLGSANYKIRCHRPRRRAIQYSRDISAEHCRLWNTGSPGQAGRRHRGEKNFAVAKRSAPPFTLYSRSRLSVATALTRLCPPYELTCGTKSDPHGEEERSSVSNHEARSRKQVVRLQPAPSTLGRCS